LAIRLALTMALNGLATAKLSPLRQQVWNIDQSRYFYDVRLRHA
jgi:hypothetical protein